MSRPEGRVTVWHIVLCSLSDEGVLLPVLATVQPGRNPYPTSCWHWHGRGSRRVHLVPRLWMTQLTT